MARFRNYKNYNSDNTRNIDDYWTSDTFYDYNNKIPSKGIFRELGDMIKYGRSKKEVLR